MTEHVGWVKKKGDKAFDGYKERYWVARGAVLEYWAPSGTDKGAKGDVVDERELAGSYSMKGSIPLAEVSEVSEGEVSQNGRAFRVRCPDRVYQLSASEAVFRRFRSVVEARSSVLRARRRAELLVGHGCGEFTFSGWLKKRGGSVKSWKRRYATLEGNVLKYFETEDAARSGTSRKDMKGRVVVVSAQVWNDADADAHGYGIWIDIEQDATSRTKRSDAAFLAAARSSAERDAWLAALSPGAAAAVAAAATGLDHMEGPLDCSTGPVTSVDAAIARRYVVLDGSYLRCYASKDDARAKGRLLGSCWIAARSDAAQGDEASSKGRALSRDATRRDVVNATAGGLRDVNSAFPAAYAFALVPEDRATATVVLRAPNGVDFDAWVAACDTSLAKVLEPLAPVALDDRAPSLSEAPAADAAVTNAVTNPMAPNDAACSDCAALSEFGEKCDACKASEPATDDDLETPSPATPAWRSEDSAIELARWPSLPEDAAKKPRKKVPPINVVKDDDDTAGSGDRKKGCCAIA